MNNQIIEYRAENITPSTITPAFTYFDYQDLKPVKVPQDHQYSKVLNWLLDHFGRSIMFYSLAEREAFVWFDDMHMHFSFSYNEPKIYILFAGKTFRILSSEPEPFIECLEQIHALQKLQNWNTE